MIVIVLGAAAGENVPAGQGCRLIGCRPSVGCKLQVIEGPLCRKVDPKAVPVVEPRFCQQWLSALHEKTSAIERGRHMPGDVHGFSSLFHVDRF